MPTAFKVALQKSPALDAWILASFSLMQLKKSDVLNNYPGTPVFHARDVGLHNTGSLRLLKGALS